MTKLAGSAGEPAERPLKILWFMRHAGYVRNFVSTFTLLSERGHQVELAFDQSKPTPLGQDNLERTEALCRRAPGLSFGFTPNREDDHWFQFGRLLRQMLDYLRYLEPGFEGATKLRRRAEQRIPWWARKLLLYPVRQRPRGRRWVGLLLRRANAARPASDEVERFIRERAPDLVIVTPLIELGSPQVDYVRTARQLGIPSCLCVASWDNLTNKGVIYEQPDRVTLWNQSQRAEATELHEIDETEITITGAQNYDHWFSWSPSRSREDFCADVGLDSGRPILLYLCSSYFIAPEETAFIRRWIGELRGSGLSPLRDAAILIRPHPQNLPCWEGVDLEVPGEVAVWPPAGADSIDDEQKNDFFDSLHHAEVVVGVNTSALIESAVVGRDVHTVLAPEFHETQRGTLHFTYLSEEAGGPLRIAETFPEHLAQLNAALEAGIPKRNPHRNFLERFIRPFGLDEPGTPRLVAAIEAAAEVTPDPAPSPSPVLRALLEPLSFVVHSRLKLQRQARELASLSWQYAQSGWRRVARLWEGGAEGPPEPASGGSEPGKTVLFIMQYPGYLRYYDSTVRELARRGYRVQLAFDHPQKQEEGLRALEHDGDGIEVLGRLVKRDDFWQPFARGLRGTLDYLKYLDRRYATNGYFRRRWEVYLPPAARPLTRVRSLPRPVIRSAVRLLQALEGAVPRAREVDDFLTRTRPDVVVLSPLVTTTTQTDVVKSAQALGIPTVAGIASWDHLTTKGLIRVAPDRIVLWNSVQAAEATDLHLADPDTIAVTGAQPFDRWFERSPSTTREEFCAKVGLPLDREFVLFVGSTASISEPFAERRFVKEWVQAVRSSSEARVRELSVLIRPHPYNSEHWAVEDLAGINRAALWPRDGANPVDEEDREDYFDSLYHCAAVVGINTSAMVEAAILGKAVHTIRTSTFRSTQDEALHFKYLLPENGGFLRVASGLEEHCRQLAETLADPELTRIQTARFVSSFLRPNGLDVPCTPLVADEIETAARRGRPPQPSARPALLLRPLVWPMAISARYEDRLRLAKDIERGARRLALPLRNLAQALEARGAARQALLARHLAKGVERRGKRLGRRARPDRDPAHGSRRRRAAGGRRERRRGEERHKSSPRR